MSDLSGTNARIIELEGRLAKIRRLWDAWVFHIWRDNPFSYDTGWSDLYEAMELLPKQEEEYE